MWLDPFFSVAFGDMARRTSANGLGERQRSVRGPRVVPVPSTPPWSRKREGTRETKDAAPGSPRIGRRGALRDRAVLGEMASAVRGWRARSKMIGSPDRKFESALDGLQEGISAGSQPGRHLNACIPSFGFVERGSGVRVGAPRGNGSGWIVTADGSPSTRNTGARSMGPLTGRSAGWEPCGPRDVACPGRVARKADPPTPPFPSPERLAGRDTRSRGQHSEADVGAQPAFLAGRQAPTDLPHV